MTKWYIMVFGVMLAACTNDLKQRELDITAYPKSGEIPVGADSEPIFYPNPFYEQVSLLLNEPSEFTVNIANKEGAKMLELNGESVTLDFSNESKGAYNAEVLVNGKIYRYTLLKGN